MKNGNKKPERKKIYPCESCNNLSKDKGKYKRELLRARRALFIMRKQLIESRAEVLDLREQLTNRARHNASSNPELLDQDSEDWLKG